MPLAGFEPTIPAGEWPQTHALGRAATAGTGVLKIDVQKTLKLLKYKNN
jgi:hypothetical protein